MRIKPWRITIDTNPDQCNLKCTMCDTHSIYNAEPIKRKRMDSSVLGSIIKQAVKSGVQEIIPSTMGEPLLYPHFNQFIENLKGTNTKLNLTTNGTFPKKGVEKWAEELLPITSDTKISINGITPQKNESVMIGANTVKAIENIKSYLHIRDKIRATSDQQPTVTLQVTFMKGTLSGIKEVIKFAIENNVDRVKGHHLWVTHKELGNESLRNHPEIWNQFIDEIGIYRKDIKLENFIKLSDLSYIPEAYDCPFLGEEVWIDHEGKYNVCCAPSKERVTLGEFDTIAETPINQVFSTDNYKALLSNYKKQELCQKCSLRKPK